MNTLKSKTKRYGMVHEKQMVGLDDHGNLFSLQNHHRTILRLGTKHNPISKYLIFKSRSNKICSLLYIQKILKFKCSVFGKRHSCFTMTQLCQEEESQGYFALFLIENKIPRLALPFQKGACFLLVQAPRMLDLRALDR